MTMNFGDMATWPRLLEIQRERETSCISEGVRRYKEDVIAAKARGEELDTPPGVRLSVDILPALEAAIKGAQDEAVKSLGAGTPALWCGPILFLSAAKIAVITLRTVLGSPFEAKAQKLAWGIATNIRTEREFELWKDAERDKVREDPDEVDVHKLMLRNIRKINTRAAKEWMRKSGTYAPVNWTTAQKLSLGSALLQLLVWEGKGWFEFVTIVTRKNGKPNSVSTVRLTKLGRSYLEEQHDIVAEWRPWLTPMVVPPLRWERQTKETPSD